MDTNVRESPPPQNSLKNKVQEPLLFGVFWYLKLLVIG